MTRLVDDSLSTFSTCVIWGWKSLLESLWDTSAKEACTLPLSDISDLWLQAQSSLWSWSEIRPLCRNLDFLVIRSLQSMSMPFIHDSGYAIPGICASITALETYSIPGLHYCCRGYIILCLELAPQNRDASHRLTTETRCALKSISTRSLPTKIIDHCPRYFCNFVF